MKKYAVYIGLAAAIAGAGAFAFHSLNSQKTLKTYQPVTETRNYLVYENTEPETEPEYITFTDQTNHVSFEVPEGWKNVKIDGCQTFVHQATGASIQLQVSDYDPVINNTDESTVSANVAQNGYTFAGYTRLSDTSYEALYQDVGSEIYDYIEEVYWYREKIITLICTVKDSDYDDLLPYYQTVIDSFTWEASDPVPDGYYLYYNTNLDFEMGVPDTWSFGETDEAVYAVDPDGNASMTLTVLENETHLGDVTASDISKLFCGTYSSFTMTTYTNDTDTCHAICSFIDSDVYYEEDIYGYSNGTDIFFLTFRYLPDMFDSSISETCSGLFRSFYAGN